MSSNNNRPRRAFTSSASTLSNNSATSLVTLKNFISKDEENQEKVTSGLFLHPLLDGNEDDIYNEYDDTSGDHAGSSSNQNNNNCFLNFLKKYKFELLIIFTLLALLAAPSYFIGKMVNTNFEVHDECLSCFNQQSQSSGSSSSSSSAGPQQPAPSHSSRHNFVYNHTGKVCVSNTNFSKGDDSGNSNEVLKPGIVYTPDFCGAPECQSKVLITGVRSIPYWLVFISAMFGVVSSIFINIVKDCLSPYCERNEIIPDENIDNHTNDFSTPPRNNNNGDEKNNLASPGSPSLKARDFFERLKIASERDNQLSIVNFVYRTAKLFGSMDPYYYTILYIATTIHFFYIIYEVHTHVVYQDFSAWKRYEAVYAIWLNSGAIQILCFTWSQFIFSIFFEIVHREFEKQFSWYFERDKSEKRIRIALQQEKEMFTILMSPLCTTVFARYTVKDFVEMISEKLSSCCSSSSASGDRNNRKTAGSSDSHSVVTTDTASSIGDGESSVTNSSFDSESDCYSNNSSFDAGPATSVPVPGATSGKSNNAVQIGESIDNGIRASRRGHRRTSESLMRRLFNFATITGVIHVVPPLLLPFLITHVIPAMFIFAPLIIPIVIIYLFLVIAFLEGWITPEPFFQSTLRMYSWFFFLRVFGTFCVLYFVQTLGNFAVMFYTGQYDWHDVIRYEFLHRSTRCYANAFVNGLDVYVVGLVGLVFV